MRGARDLRLRHERVGRVHHRGLGRTVEQFAGVPGVPLVELVVAGDQHRGGAAGAPARAADLLAHRRERAGEAVEHHGVERTDVDAQLQRARGDDAAERPVGEPGLERAPLVGEVARAVRGDVGYRPAGRGDCGDHRACLRGHELRAAPAAGERERLVPLLHETREQHGGLDVGRRARTTVLVEQRSLPHREAALGARRAVVAHCLDRQPAQRGRERGGVADRRAGETERGRRAVIRAEPPQPPQHVRDVAAEQAAQRVQLVDHHIAEPHQERGPPRVRRQDARVQHLRIGEQHVGVRARPGAVVGCGVAVVGGGDQIREEPLPEAAQLVLRERLGGVHDQRGVAGVAHHRLDDRHLVTQRLARRGAARDHDAAPRAQRVDCARLVGVERVHTAGAAASPRWSGRAAWPSPRAPPPARGRAR